MHIYSLFAPYDELEECKKLSTFDSKNLFGCDPGVNCGLCPFCIDSKILGIKRDAMKKMGFERKGNCSGTAMNKDLMDEIWRRLINVGYEDRCKDVLAGGGGQEYKYEYEHATRAVATPKSRKRETRIAKEKPRKRRLDEKRGSSVSEERDGHVSMQFGTNVGLDMGSKAPNTTATATTTATTTTTPSSSAAPTSSIPAATSTSAAAPAEPLSCTGRVRGRAWGCGRCFPKIADLKAHWATPGGAGCLQAFVQLRGE